MHPLFVHSYFVFELVCVLLIIMINYHIIRFQFFLDNIHQLIQR